MWYLFFQTWAWILFAFILGMLVGWWLCGRCRCKGEKSSDDQSTAVSTAAVTSAAVEPSASVASVNTAVDADELQVEDDWKPAGFSDKPADADDLKRIKGVGPVIEKTLNGLGIYQFKQIGEFTRDNISWVDKYISFPGRIDREEWVQQAKDLAKGKDTEFSKRVDKGEMDY